MGESIRNRTNQQASLLNSKVRPLVNSKVYPLVNSIRNSFKGGVKQSIGANDSDMDFDLELD